MLALRYALDRDIPYRLDTQNYMCQTELHKISFRRSWLLVYQYSKF